MPVNTSLARLASGINRRAFIAGTAGIAATATLPGRVFARETGTLRIGQIALGGENLDPTIEVRSTVSHIHLMLYDCLFEIGPDSELIPGLAESHTVDESGTVWTFKLREGVQFHGGYGEVTAEDAVFSINRWMQPEVASSGRTALVDAVKDMRVIDRYAPFIVPDGSMTMWKEDPAAMSLPILNRARGKQSVTLNLKTSEGLRIYKSLVERADVVMENFASGTADRLGIGYETTSAINPRIIYCSISGFGWGEMLNRKAFDVIIQAMSGMMLASGEEGDPPVRIGMSIADSIAPLYAVMGINAALYRREMTGEGEYVDISMLGALTGLLASEEWQALEAVGGKTRTGNFNIRATPFGAFRCRDAHIAIGAGSQDHFACALFRVMGRPEWAEDPNYARNPERSKRNAEVCAAVEEWCGSRTADEVEATLLEVGVPVGKVRTPAESLADPALQARRDITNSVHPDLGPVGGLHTVDLPIRFHKSDYGTGSAAPRLGQHNTAVYRDWLGFSDEELEAWKADQVI